jgi:hypothetical protein
MRTYDDLVVVKGLGTFVMI